jgi:hypothetical protein
VIAITAPPDRWREAVNVRRPHVETRELDMTNDTHLRELTVEEIEAVAGGAKIQDVVQAWFTCLKSCADAKGQVQQELARFR